MASDEVDTAEDDDEADDEEEGVGEEDDEDDAGGAGACNGASDKFGIGPTESASSHLQLLPWLLALLPWLVLR